MNEFFMELKRRRVFRVATAYAAAGFIVWQAADIAFPALGLPDWLVTAVVALTLVGFPLALVLAWAYDLTPAGVVRAEPGFTASRQLGRIGAAGVVGLTLALLVGGGAWWLRAADTADDGALRVVAVLPFEHISVGASDGHFAAGMRAEILSQLSRLADLRLMSTASIAELGNAPDRLRRLVVELGVGSIVEGSVRMVDGRARIDVQLTDARSGRTLWSEQYDRELADVLAVQTDVALRISEALRVRLTPGERERITRPPTDNPHAYDLFLRGREIWGFSQEAMLEAAELYREATRLDPRFALAHAHLGHTFHHLGRQGVAFAADSGMAAVERALAIDSTLAFAHFARGQFLASAGRHAESRLAFLRALEFDPNEIPAMADLSVNLARAGRLDESLHWAEEALKRAPNLALTHHHVAVPLLALGDDAATERFLLEGLRSTGRGLHRVHTHLAWLDLYRGRTREALERIRSLAVADPQNFEVQSSFASLAGFAGVPEADSLVAALFQRHPDRAITSHAAVLLGRGNAERAERLLAEAHARALGQVEAGDGSAERMELARIHALRGEPDAALKWLQSAYEAGYRNHREMRLDPALSTLRGAPGFRELEAAMEADVGRMRARAMTTSALLQRLTADRASR